LPKLVKIQIETENDGYWPEMVIDLKSEPNPIDEDNLSLQEDGQMIDDLDTLEQQ
jgi:hypothetical protein